MIKSLIQPYQPKLLKAGTDFVLIPNKKEVEKIKLDEQIKAQENRLKENRQLEKGAEKWISRINFNLRENNKLKPISFLQLRNPSMKWPKIMKKIFATIWHEKAQRVIMKGPRGGGKSQVVSAIGYLTWFFKKRGTIVMGGALEQAKKVYSYFLEHLELCDPKQKYLFGDPTITRTLSEDKVPFKCVAASPKQVRGPHEDSLFIDEACEAKDELIKDALPIVNTSQHPLIVMTSTFHKIFGIFQEIWDQAEQFGYLRISWDIFDICQPFNAKMIWDDPKLKREILDLEILQDLSKGRTGDREGWIPIKNIIQAWREKPTLDWFLVEYMGHRPSAAGLILRPEDVDLMKFDDTKQNQYNYIKDAEQIIGIDWGFSSMTSVVDLMKHIDDVKVLLWNKNYTQIRSEIIIADVVKRVKKFSHRYILADSAGKFENAALRHELAKAGLACSVIEVVFSKEKEMMIGNLRAHSERQKLKIPQKYIQAIWQLKRYRYQEGSDKPMKKDDHIPDALMCALQKWPLTKSPAIFKQHQKEKKQTITGGLMDTKF